jgi:hypothetical protein
VSTKGDPSSWGTTGGISYSGIDRHHGTVAAYLALLIAVGGTAYAGATITRADVVNGSLTERDTKNDSLKPRDMKWV